MYKKIVKFEDLSGNEVTEDFYFHIYKVDLVRRGAGNSGGWSDYIKKLTEEDDTEKIFAEIEWLVQFSYGVKGKDDLVFHKSAELLNEFVQSPRYDAVIMSILQSEKEAAAFVNGIFPSDLQRAWNQIATEVKEKTGKDVEELSPAEIQALTEEIQNEQDEKQKQQDAYKNKPKPIDN